MSDCDLKGWPAFPHLNPDYDGQWMRNPQRGGMPLQAYAAIALRIPLSGIEWLDEMILLAQRDDLAARVMAGMMSRQDAKVSIDLDRGIGFQQAQTSYAIADALMAARRDPKI